MDPAYLHPRFFKHFDPARWESEVCAELAPALNLLLAEPDNAIASMGLENIKMPDLVVLLRHPPSPETIAKVEALCADYPELSAGPDGVVRFEHYHGIEWDLPAPPLQSPPPPKPSFWRRLFG